MTADGPITSAHDGDDRPLDGAPDPRGEPALATVAAAAYLLGTALVLSPFLDPSLATLTTLALVAISWLVALLVWAYRAARIADGGRSLTLWVVGIGVVVTVLAGNLGPTALELAGTALVGIGVIGAVVRWVVRVVRRRRV